MSSLPTSLLPSSSPLDIPPPSPSSHYGVPAAENSLSSSFQGSQIEGTDSPPQQMPGPADSPPSDGSGKKKAVLNPFAKEFVPSSPASPGYSGFAAGGDSEGLLNSCEVFSVESPELSETQHESTHEILLAGEGYQVIDSFSGNTLGDSGGLSTTFRQEQTGRGRGLGASRTEQMDNIQLTSVGTTSTTRRGHFSNANHLLNFQYDPIPRPPRRGPPPRRQHRPQPYNKEHFLQANFRFLVSDFGDYLLNSSDPDKMLQWEDIAAVNVSAPESIQCPICLESPPLCPQITFCGHIFCFPCILRYLLMGEEEHKCILAKKCPLCFAMMSCKDLRTVYIDDVHSYQVGDVASFTLLTRAKGSVIPFEMSEPVVGSLPYSNDGQCHRFSKFTLTPDAEQTSNKAISELSKWVETNENAGGDLELLPYVCAAIDQLQQRNVAWREHRTSEFLSSSPPVRQRIMAQTKAGLTKVPTQGFSEPDASVSVTEGANNTLQKRQGVEKVDVTAETEAAMSELKNKACWVYETAFSDEEDNKMRNRATRQNKSKGKALEQQVQKDAIKDVVDAPSSWENLLEDTDNSKNSGGPGTADPDQKIQDLKKDLDDRESYTFYQIADGQSVILHPLNMKCLLEHYGSYDMLPTRLQGKIVEMETITQTEATRKRYRYLSHLPLTTNFQLCEVDLKGVLPSAALGPFMEELRFRENRRRRRIKQQQEERAREERAAMSISKSMPPPPSEFRAIMASFDDELPSSLDFEDSVSDLTIGSIRPPLDERNLFSRVTKLGFASAHDAPALGPSKGGDVNSSHVQSASSTVAKLCPNGTSDSMESRISTMSFADVIQAQPSKVAESDSSGTSTVPRSSTKKGKKHTKVLLSTAGGRRY